MHKGIHIVIHMLAAAALLSAPSATAIYPSDALPDETAWLAELDSIPASCSQPVESLWRERVDSIRWVAYSSPNPEPDARFYRPAPEAIYKDLTALRKAGFTGLITYASAGIMGKQFLQIAGELGYEGVLMGIWSPDGQDELNNAAGAASLPIVLGYSIGNEGLGDSHHRYSPPELCAAITALRAQTGKPVTTSEAIEIYYRWPQVLNIGDWLFPISHPYWHFTKYAEDAIRWEQDQYEAISALSDRYVFFKEVGLPTAGAAGLSEANQDSYYRGLAKTGVRFAYFEGFDQPSKTGASVEPHWGIFHSNLTPKLLGWNLMGYRVFSGEAGSAAANLDCTTASSCSAHAAGMLLIAGDDRGETQHRAILSFNTAALPDNAIITAVKLRLRSAGIAGANPLTSRRALVVDVCSLSLDVAGARPGILPLGDADCVMNAGAFGDRPNSGWYTAELSPGSFGALNSEGATQFHIRVSGPGAPPAASRAYIRFFAPDAAEADAPVLLVRYRLP